MRVRVLGVAMAVTLLVGLAHEGARAQSGACDRACLNGFVDQYLAALVARDPARLPLTGTAKYTENGQALKLGDGMWSPEITLGTYKLYFADPQAGQVGAFVTLAEHGHPTILGIRLKVENRLIGEMEAIVIRSTPGGLARPNDLVDKPVFSEVVPPAERRPRDEMIRIANSYFEGLEQATEKLTPFEPTCQRIENGVITANNPAGANPMAKMDCGAQFATGFSKIITEVRERRFPIVDEERGLVYAIVFFDHSGRNKTTMWADGQAHPVNAPFDEPLTFEIGELFKIRNGKIVRVEALVLNVPYGMPSGWVKRGEVLAR
jgi:hypothetical protein